MVKKRMAKWIIGDFILPAVLFAVRKRIFKLIDKQL